MKLLIFVEPRLWTDLSGGLAFEVLLKQAGVHMNAQQGNEFREFRSQHEVRVGDISTPICLQVYRRKSDGKLLIEQSHFIKTGIQYLPYAVSEFQGFDETAAVNELEKNILGFYEQAVRRGYASSESWLVPNSNFHEL